MNIGENTEAQYQNREKSNIGLYFKVEYLI